MSEQNETTQKVIELVSEEDYLNQVLDNSENVLIPVVTGIQEYLIEFAKKKLLDSIELQQFINDRELEFYQKYVDLFTEDRGHFNNHNDLEELPVLQLTLEERERARTEANTKLIQLKKKKENLGRREQKTYNYFSSGFEHLKIRAPTVDSSYKVKNESWISYLSNSITLQKIKMICEKLLKVSLTMEASFWITEVVNLIEKLGNEREKEVAFGIIVEMTSWYSDSDSDSQLMTLVNSLFEKEESKKHVYLNLEQVCSVENQKIENHVWNVKVLAALFIKLSVADQVYYEKIGQNICQLMIKTLKNNELEVNHLIGIIEIFETVGEKLRAILEKFDQVFSLFESKTNILERSQQVRVTQLMRFRSIRTPLRSTSIPTATSNTRVKMRHMTVIEYPSMEVDPDQMEIHSQINREELDRLARIRIQEELRNKEEERKRKEAEENAQMVQENENQRAHLEKIQETHRKRMEENAQRIAQMETERAAQEEAIRILQNKQMAHAAYRRNNRCTFLKETILYKHFLPNLQSQQDVFDGKIIGLYFSGYWCPPSKDFTPVLRNFHAQVKDSFDVLFISSDNNEQEMNQYMREMHGDWYHLPFQSYQGEHLSNSIGVTSIPTLIIVKPNGAILTKDGRSQVMNCQYPERLVNEWKSM